MTEMSDMTALLASGDTSDLCARPMSQYACASLQDVSAPTIGRILSCYRTDPNAVTSEMSFSLIMNQLPLDTIMKTLNTMTIEVDDHSMPNYGRYLFRSVWRRLTQEKPKDFTPGFMASWMQMPLYPFLPSIDQDIFDCMTSLPLSCNTFEAVCGALNLVYPKFDENKQEEIGRWIAGFMLAHSCKKATSAETMNSFFGSFQKNANIDTILIALGTTEPIDVTFFTAYQLSDYVNKFDSFNTYEKAMVILPVLETKDIAFMHTFLSNLQGSNYNIEILKLMLNIMMKLINSSNDPLCRQSLKIFTDKKISYILKGVDSSILDEMKPEDCSEFHDFYQAIDGAVWDSPEDIQILVSDFRMKFLDSEVTKSGYSCTYGLTSQQWMKANLGNSAKFFSIPKILFWNPGFNGFDAIDDLTVKQTVELIRVSNLFTSNLPVNHEENMSALTRQWKTSGYKYLTKFMLEFRLFMTEMKPKTIMNSEVQNRFLEAAWDTAKPQFSTFKTSDWQEWFGDYMSIGLPAITTTQLSDLSNTVVGGCANMQTIVAGFDSAWEFMEELTKGYMATWIIGLLKNYPDKCMGDNSLSVNFKRFLQSAEISDVREVDSGFSLFDSLDLLTAGQIGEALVTEPDALSNVAFCKTVMDTLKKKPDTVGAFKAFWINFNLAYSEDNVFPDEVKKLMLDETLVEIYSQLSTAESSAFWLEDLSSVLVVIDKDILNKWPEDMDSDSYKAFTRAVSKNYADATPTSKEDVFKFMTNYMTKNSKATETETSTTKYILNSWGAYSAELTYGMMTSYYRAFNPMELGVWQILTPTQFGDMIVETKMYESKESITQIFDYLGTLPVDGVRTAMAQVAQAVEQKGLVIGEDSAMLMFERYSAIMMPANTIQGTWFANDAFFMSTNSFSKKSLDLLGVEDCDTLSATVGELDKQYPRMSDNTRNAIGSWILEKLNGEKLNGCVRTSETSSTWLGEYFIKFSLSLPVSLKEMLKVNPSLDLASIMGKTSTRQKVEYLFIGDVLQSLEKVKSTLETLRGEDGTVPVSTIYEFLGDFNEVYKQPNVQKMTPEVREASMTFFFTNLMSNRNSWTNEQMSQYVDTHVNVLPGFTEEALNAIPMTMPCNMYQTIFSGFGSVIDELSEDIRRSTYTTMIKYLQTQKDVSKDVCSSMYSDSRTYVENMYFGFERYGDPNEIGSFYSAFKMYEVISLFTGQQLGNLFMNSAARTNLDDATQILMEMNNRDSSDVLNFMSECAKAAKELNIVRLSDANIAIMLSTTVFRKISVQLRTAEDLSIYFGGDLSFIMPYMTVEDISALSVSDCESMKLVVKDFSDVYDRLSDGQKQAIYGQIKAFNKNQKDTKGSACPTDSGSSTEWMMTYIGMFVPLATLRDMEESNANFNAAEALDAMSGDQCAQYAMDSGALWNTETMATICKSITTRDQMHGFLVKLNEAMPDTLKTSSSAKVITSHAFGLYSVAFRSFMAKDWSAMMDDLKNVLHAVDGTDLERIPLPMSCGDYHILVQAFNDAHENMKEETRETVCNTLMKSQLSKAPTQNGVRCGNPSDRSQVWMDKNFGFCSQFVDMSVVTEWFPDFHTLDVVDTLTPSQLGQFAGESIDNKDVACQVVARVQELVDEEIANFFDTLTTSMESSNAKVQDPEIAYKYLSLLSKPEFIKHNRNNMDRVLTTWLPPFSAFITADQLQTMLSSADCDGYTTSVKVLSSVSDQFSADTQKSLFGVLKAFLQKQSSPSGPCPKSGESSADTIERLYGAFKPYESISEFAIWLPITDLLDVAYLFSPEQKADLAFRGNVLTDMTEARKLSSNLKNLNMKDCERFVSQFKNNVDEKEMASLPSIEVAHEIFSSVFDIMVPQLNQRSNEYWTDFWGEKINPFISSLDESQIAKIPDDINCFRFAAFMSGCSKRYSELPEPTQIAICNKAKKYHMKEVSATGPRCPASSGAEWMTNAFALFGECCTMQELLWMYPTLSVSSAPEYFTPDQLGSYAAKPEVLSDKGEMQKLMSATNGDNIGVFLDAFNDEYAKAGIDHISNIEVKKFMLDDVLCKLGPGMAAATTSDYDAWFRKRLSLFSSSFDAKALGFIPLNINCDSLAVVMKSLNEAKKPEYPDDVCRFAMSRLEAQKTSSGDACTAGLSSRPWLTKYLGEYCPKASWKQITNLNPNFQAMDCVDLMTVNQLASASVTTPIINNPTALRQIVVSMNGNLESITTYLTTMNTLISMTSSVLSKKAKEMLLMTAAEQILPKMTSSDLSTTENSFKAIAFLFPAINRTILGLIPKEMSCEQYQLFVGTFDSVRPKVSPVRSQAVGEFQKDFLNYKNEMEGDPCAMGIGNKVLYLMKNIGNSCEQFTSDEISRINPDISAASFEAYCSLLTY